MNGLVVPLGQVLAAGDGPLSHLASVAGVVFSAWVGAAALVLVLHATLTARARVRLRAAAAAIGFTEHEIRWLWDLYRRTPAAFRAAMLSGPAGLDDAVAAARAQAGSPAAWPECLHDAVLRPLRRRMASEAKSLAQLERSREIEANQPCTVLMADGCAFDSFVTRVTPHDVQIALPEGRATAPSLRPGATLEVSFWRANDARYQFTATVLDAALGSLFVAHASVARVQERRHVRVRFRQPIRVAALARTLPPALRSDSDTGVLVSEASLQDISQGGACFVSSLRLPAGAWVVLQVRRPDDTRRIRIPAKVLRETPLSGTSRRLHRTAVRFHVPSPRVENDLAHFVSDLQQSQLSRIHRRTPLLDADPLIEEALAPKRTSAHVDTVV